MCNSCEFNLVHVFFRISQVIVVTIITKDLQNIIRRWVFARIWILLQTIHLNSCWCLYIEEFVWVCVFSHHVHCCRPTCDQSPPFLFSSEKVKEDLNDTNTGRTSGRGQANCYPMNSKRNESGLQSSVSHKLVLQTNPKHLFPCLEEWRRPSLLVWLETESWLSESVYRKAVSVTTARASTAARRCRHGRPPEACDE